MRTFDFSLDERERDWVHLGNATIGCVGKTPGIIQLTEYNGLDISHFKLVHQEGLLKIPFDTIFAVEDNENGIVVTTNASNPLDETTFYAPSNLNPSIQANRWPYPGLTGTTKEIVLRNKLPFFIRELDFLHFWHYEDFLSYLDGDNAGSMTVAVYALGKRILVWCENRVL